MRLGVRRATIAASCRRRTPDRVGLGREFADSRWALCRWWCSCRWPPRRRHAWRTVKPGWTGASARPHAAGRVQRRDHVGRRAGIDIDDVVTSVRKKRSREFPVSEAVLTRAIGLQAGPDIEWNGSVFFVAWADTRETGDEETRDIYGTRVSSGGRVLDPGGIAISTGDDNESAIPESPGTGAASSSSGRPTATQGSSVEAARVSTPAGSSTLRRFSSSGMASSGALPPVTARASWRTAVTEAYGPSG